MKSSKLDYLIVIECLALPIWHIVHFALILFYEYVTYFVILKFQVP